jgi:hypothetical protein
VAWYVMPNYTVSHTIVTAVRTSNLTKQYVLLDPPLIWRDVPLRLGLHTKQTTANMLNGIVRSRTKATELVS